MDCPGRRADPRLIAACINWIEAEGMMRLRAGSEHSFWIRLGAFSLQRMPAAEGTVQAVDNMLACFGRQL